MDFTFENLVAKCESGLAWNWSNEGDADLLILALIERLGLAIRKGDCCVSGYAFVGVCRGLTGSIERRMEGIAEGRRSEKKESSLSSSLPYRSSVNCCNVLVKTVLLRTLEALVLRVL